MYFNQTFFTFPGCQCSFKEGQNEKKNKNKNIQNNNNKKHKHLPAAKKDSNETEKPGHIKFLSLMIPDFRYIFSFLQKGNGGLLILKQMNFKIA